MHKVKQKYASLLNNIFAFLLGSLLFVLIYTQSPLYSSNQNQYFLQGMAQANMGSLNQDWLANTREPTPLFTFLVKWVFLLLHNPVWFYILYGLLAGVYFWSLLGILDSLFHIRKSRITFILSITLILIAHSATLRFLLGNTLGENWRFLFDGGVAGQRLLGTVLQPSVFGVLLMAALFLYLSKKPVWASLLSAAAAVIHPTYLLTAALLVAGFMLQTWLEEKDLKKILKISIPALVLVTPILVYIFNNFWGLDGAENAREILAEIRLPHHALISVWFDRTVIIKILLVFSALIALRKENRIFIPLCVITCSVIILSVYQYVTGSLLLALIFPWRPSTMLVPVASSVLLAKLAMWLSGLIDKTGQKYIKLTEIACYMTLLALCVIGMFHMRSTYEANLHTPEINMLSWVRENSTDKDRFLIPINLETFRTATLRPAYVDYFTIPYSNEDVNQWYHRVLAANKFYDSGSCEEFYHLRNDGKLTYVITEKASIQPVCKNLTKVYQDAYYVIYKYVKSK